MNGFGFIEYKDALDARDVVPGKIPSACSDSFLCSIANILRVCCSLPYVAILLCGQPPTTTLIPFESWLILPLLYNKMDLPLWVNA